MFDPSPRNFFNKSTLKKSEILRFSRKKNMTDFSSSRSPPQLGSHQFLIHSAGWTVGASVGETNRMMGGSYIQFFQTKTPWKQKTDFECLSHGHSKKAEVDECYINLEYTKRILVGGWTNPLWKIWVKSSESSPIFGVKITNVWAATT